MKIDAITTGGQQLIDAINKAINEGDLKTWKIVHGVNKNVLYSHAPEQWAGKALVRPTAVTAKATFEITWWSNNPEPSQEIKGYITGRFTEALLVHFRNY